MKLKEIEEKLTQFVDNCDCQDEIARTIKNLWISGAIGIEDAHYFSGKYGIADPLNYWKGPQQ